MIEFAQQLYDAMLQHDHLVESTGKKALQRIYRDVRFSKDKSPYKNHFGGSFRRATTALRGGYYFHITPGETFIATGFWGPNSEDLKLIRSHIAAEPDRLRDVIQQKGFRDHFEVLKGEQVKTAPKGYAKDHAAIDLLRYKQFLLLKSFTDTEVLSSSFAKKVSDTFSQARPFLDYMSEILTTDLNGISLIES